MRNVSVIIPTYNRECSIQKSVESVLRQGDFVKEIIVIDDRSTDRTERVVKEIKDERILYRKTDRNLGAGGARNFGVRLASCDWIAFHDSDDEWLEGKLEKQFSYLESHEKVGLVYSAYRAQLASGEAIVVPQECGKSKLEGDIHADLLLRNTVGAPTILMRKDVFGEVGGFDEDMRSLEDWDFAIRVSKRYAIGFLPEALVQVHVTQGGVSSDMGAYYQNRCYMLRKHRADYLKEGKFNDAVRDLLIRASEDHIQDKVEKMLVIFMSK